MLNVSREIVAAEEGARMQRPPCRSAFAALIAASALRAAALSAESGGHAVADAGCGCR